MSSSRIRDLPIWPLCPRCGERMVRTPSVVELAWRCPLGMYGDCQEALERAQSGTVDQASVDIVERECDHERCRVIAGGTKCYESVFRDSRPLPIKVDDA